MTILEIYKGRKDALMRRISESKSLYETDSAISEVFETPRYALIEKSDFWSSNPNYADITYNP